jgi:outer membrane protein
LLEQQDLDLQRNVYVAFTDARGPKPRISGIRVQTGGLHYKRFDVGLMNSFDLNQSQTLLSNAQSDVLRTKYDYIFKIKILEFYFGIPIIKTNTLCQRNQFTS